MSSGGIFRFVLPGLALVAAAAVGEIRFRDAAASVGLEFRHRHGGEGEFYMIETMGSGVVLFDYDLDGDDDVFFVDSGRVPGGSKEPSRSRLFRNDAGRFVDVTPVSGIEVSGYGMGGVAGDVDGDGDLDLYVTAYGPNQLFENLGDGTFRDGTRSSGTGEERWSTSAAMADPDGDGDLDIYVANYVDFSPATNEICGDKERRLRSYCHPDVYRPLADTYYRNDGRGRFVDATREAGFDVAPGNGLGVVFGDFRGTGWPDLYVANDMTPNFLFRNRLDGTFEETALFTGTALSDQGAPEAGMGIAVGDVNGDGLTDFIVTHLDLETNAFYASSPSGVYVDRRFLSGVAPASALRVGFGVSLADFDQDGDLDLVVANGHIIHNIEDWGRGTTYKQPNQVLENVGDGRFRELPDAGLGEARSSRGLAVGDLDLDGDLDWVVSNSDDEAEYYANETTGSGSWLLVAFGAEGGSGGAPFGVGAAVRSLCDGRWQRREIHTGSSYLSQSQLAAHFGFGECRSLAQLEARVPGETPVRFKSVPTNRRILIAPARRVPRP